VPPARTPDPTARALLTGLRLQAGPGGAARQVDSVDFRLDGAQFVRWSDAPSVAGPDGSSAVRLMADAGHAVAFAVYQLDPQANAFEALPKRLHIEIEPAVGSGLPLEYYVGVADFSKTAWDWLGPFNGPYEPLINSDGQRDRCFDLHGVTYVAVAIAAGADGAARAADLQWLGYGTGDPYYPVKPYRVPATALQLTPGCHELAQDGTRVWASDIAAQVYAGPSGPGYTLPFGVYGADTMRVYRRPAGTGPWSDLGQPAGLYFDDAPDLPPAGAPLVPGRRYDYRFLLGNAAGACARAGRGAERCR
jgi:hypothetical protein